MENAQASSSVSAPPAPPSPGLPPLRLTETLEELFRFVLSSRLLAGGDGSDLALSPDYCARLLQDEPEPLHPHIDDIGDSSGGVPKYPLYRHLALAVSQCTDLENFQKSSSSLTSIPVDDSLKMKDREWNKLIEEKKSELMNMLNTVEFELHVQEPFFSQLKDGLKTVEGRCALGNYTRMGSGSIILFNKCLLLEVQHVTHYHTFSEMLQMETLRKVLPGVETIEEGVSVYRRFYTEEKERLNGVLAISVSKPDSQPYRVVANLLSGLNYEGIARLIGVTHTYGSVPDALPPPRSFLISSSQELARPHVKGCSLTNAARALAKHANRSSYGWWGDFAGSDSNKNNLALAVIKRLLTHCCWINVYLISPDESVFEVRVPEGYGARWSKDGLSFIGFLEPYDDEGFLKGWRH